MAQLRSTRRGCFTWNAVDPTAAFARRRSEPSTPTGARLRRVLVHLCATEPARPAAARWSGTGEQRCRPVGSSSSGRTDLQLLAGGPGRSGERLVLLAPSRCTCLQSGSPATVEVSAQVYASPRRAARESHRRMGDHPCARGVVPRVPVTARASHARTATRRAARLQQAGGAENAASRGCPLAVVGVTTAGGSREQQRKLRTQRAPTPQS